MTDEHTQDELDLTIVEVDDEIEGESKEDRFKRLMQPRYNKTVEWLRLMTKLSNRNNYDYTDEMIDAVFGSLREEIDEAEAMFRNQVSKPIKELF